jgi:hypothetical protein
MDYDGLEELLDRGTFRKPLGFSLRRVLASILF